VTATVLGTAGRLAGEEWDALAGRGFSLHGWHAAAEASGWLPRHVVVRAGESVAGIVPAYLLDGGSALDLHDRWLGPAGSLMAAAGLCLRPTISVGAPCSATTSWLGELEALSDDAIAQVFGALEAQAKEDGARAVVWPFVDERHARLREVARRLGYLDCYAGSTAVLPVAWASFDDYVAAQSKGVRRTIRAELRWVAERGYRAVMTPDFRSHVEEIAALHRAGLGRHRGRDAEVPASLFARLAEHPASGIWAQLTWRHERLVGSSMSVAAGGVLDGTFAAFAPGLLGGPVYHNDLVYEPVRLACARHLRALDLGPTALYPKVLRGARLRRRRALVRGTSRAVHGALRALAPLVAARTEWKERRSLAAIGSLEALTDR